MNNIQIIIWLFPIIFIFHDFEEIIFMQAWISKNRSYLYKRFPKFSKKLIPHFDNITTASFAVEIAEEFILISIITVICYEIDWYSLWLGLFIAFTLHLIIHCFQILIVGKYIPAIVTSVICLLICTYIIRYTVQLFACGTIVHHSVLGIVIMTVNLGIIHKFMDIFGQWLIKYENYI